eukprot:PLAT12792.1.p1 GENE.PLAT12792.1~~PLAT12792.1.p1  ORF type:complete len:279 (-),score=102.34 PLAT12792.1:28-780(-)
MVYAILIHQPTSLLFARFFTPEGNDDRVKERQEDILAAVRVQLAFYDDAEPASGGGASDEALPPSSSELLWVHSLTLADARKSEEAESVRFSEGVFRLPPAPLFAEEQVVVWRRVLSSVYTVVASPTENLVLAAQLLDVLVRLLEAVFEDELLSRSPQLLLERPEAVAAVVEELLPGGTMQIVTPSIASWILSRLQRLLAGEEEEGEAAGGGDGVGVHEDAEESGEVEADASDAKDIDVATDVLEAEKSR